MNRSIVTVYLDKTYSESEIKAYRERLVKECGNKYRLNIIICGDENYETCIENLIKTKIKS